MKKALLVLVFLNSILFYGQTTISIPDPNFEQALIDNNIDSDGIVNGQMLRSDAENVFSLSISNTPISDLTGLIHFSELESLTLSNCQINNINLSNNRRLSSLSLPKNNLENLDLSNLTVLKELYVYENNLQILDVTNNIVLSDLIANNNNITALDLSVNQNIKFLHLQNNNLSALNVKNGTNTSILDFVTNNNPNLSCVKVDNASYSTSNWTNKDAHHFFSETCAQTYVPDDNFEQRLIDLGHDDVLNDYVVTSNISSLSSIDLRFQGIVDMTGIEDFTALSTLQIQANNTIQGHLDLTNNINLVHVYCDRNLITSIDVSNLVNLKTLRANQNNIASIDLSTNTQLDFLNLSDNQLARIDVNSNASLTRLLVNNNPNLNELTVKNGANVNITEFSAIGNTNLTCIEVDNASASYLTTLPWTKDTSTNFNENCHYKQTYVPDDALEQSLIDYNLDDVLDDYVLTSNINSIPVIGFNNPTISDFTGLEDFTALEELNIVENSSYSTINLSALTQLRELTINDSQLSNVDLSQNVLLEDVNLRDNQLTSIDVSANLQIRALTINNNNITTIDLSTLIDLKFLTCSGNPLSYLNLSSNSNLDYLSASNTNITSFDFSGNPLLDQVYLRDNNLNSLDFSNNPVLQFLFVSNSKLSSVNLGPATLLEKLELQDNNLTSIDVTSSELLEELNLANNNLTAIDLSNNQDLDILNLANNSIVNLDLSNNKDGGVSEIIVNDNALELFNLKGGDNSQVNIFNALNNPNLTCIQVDDTAYSTTNWTSIDAQTSFSEFCPGFYTYVPDDNFEQALIDLGYDDVLDDYVLTNNINALTSLDVSNKGIAEATGLEGFVALESLDINDNVLTTLDVSTNVALLLVNCRKNNLATIDITNNTLLTDFYCDDNNLTALDVSKNIALVSLSFGANNITSIDLSNNTQLLVIDCPNNGLSSLDLSNNLEVFYLNGSVNAFTILDLSQNIDLQIVELNDCTNFSVLNIKNGNNSNITQFSVVNNPDLTCIQVDDTAYSTTNWTNIDAQTSFSEFCSGLYTYVPDNNFEQALIDLGYDDVLDDYVLTSNIVDVTSLSLINRGISDIIGIEDFSSLETLDIRQNVIENLNLSNNTQLITLNASDNLISTITINNSVLLEYLYLEHNVINNLNISNLTALKSLKASNNPLSTINTTNNTALRGLKINNTNYSSISIAHLTELRDISISNTAISVLNTDANSYLYVVIAENTNITSLDFSNNLDLAELYATQTPLSFLDVSENTMLTELRISDNTLTNFGMSHLINLEHFRANNTAITDLDFTTMPYLNYVYIEDNANLKSVNAKNGENQSILKFWATGNPNLTCIQVDDENGAYLSATISQPGGEAVLKWQKDDAANFNDFCGDHVQLSPILYLQGPSISPNVGEEMLMRDDLRVANYIPTTSPYSDAVTCESTVFDDGGTNGLGLSNDNIVDWIWVELRDATDNTSIVSAQSALLQRDGDVVAVDGVSPLSFDVSADNYFVSINHRNHLGIMSSTALALTSTTTAVDFTNATNEITYGVDAQSTFGLPSGVVGMWSGNVNGDNSVRYLGSGNDTNSLKDEVIYDSGNASGSNLHSFTGYNVGDVNLDGTVKYQGSVNDTNTIKDIILSHPDNQSSPSNLFTIEEQLPEN